MYSVQRFDIMTLDEKHDKFVEITNDLRRKGYFRKWYELAELLGVSANTISGAKNKNENYLTSNLLARLEDINLENQKTPVPVQSNKGGGISAMVPQSQSMKLIPTIPIHAYRATNFDVMAYFANTTDELKMSPIIMQFPGTDCYYFVNSEDMSPYLRTNDLLCLSRLPDDARVTNGDICIINTKSQGLLERFVYDDGDALLVKSSQPRWTDMRIPKDEIFNIFRILGGIRTNI